ncbi:MAG: DUF1295 domain-containing protein [Chloroflexi bacterium]|nr:DUF1295 domain-containing protein [Chloroflexota bacterium]
MHDTYAYGLWGAVIFNVLFFLLFALSFLTPRRKWEWRSLGLFGAFLVALFTEMYGFPLTIYILTSVLGNVYPASNPFAHGSGHLWGVLLGGWSLLLCTLGSLLMIAGLVVMGIGWKKIHRARGELVTEGIYSLVRHPQYLGLLLIIVGMLIQWPTIITILMAPVLMLTYYWLARKEEKELEERFGDRYKIYKEKTPAFLPVLATNAKFSAHS